MSEPVSEHSTAWSSDEVHGPIVVQHEAALYGGAVCPCFSRCVCVCVCVCVCACVRACVYGLMVCGGVDMHYGHFSFEIEEIKSLHEREDWTVQAEEGGCITSLVSVCTPNQYFLSEVRTYLLSLLVDIKHELHRD